MQELPRRSALLQRCAMAFLTALLEADSLAPARLHGSHAVPLLLGRHFFEHGMIEVETPEPHPSLFGGLPDPPAAAADAPLTEPPQIQTGFEPVSGDLGGGSTPATRRSGTEPRSQLSDCFARAAAADDSAASMCSAASAPPAPTSPAASGTPRGAAPPRTDSQSSLPIAIRGAGAAAAGAGAGAAPARRAASVSGGSPTPFTQLSPPAGGFVTGESPVVDSAPSAESFHDLGAPSYGSSPGPFPSDTWQDAVSYNERM